MPANDSHWIKEAVLRFSYRTMYQMDLNYLKRMKNIIREDPFLSQENKSMTLLYLEGAIGALLLVTNKLSPQDAPKQT